MDAARLALDLSLVIPAYNEAAGIALAVAEADDVLAASFETYEILVVDDGSSDDTAAIVAGLARNRPNVRLLGSAVNRGYGAALRTGFAAARCGRVAFTDADRQFDIRDLVKLAEATDAAPVAVGIRVNRQDPWRRRMLSKGYNVLARAWLGTRVRDCDCALKVFRRETLAHLMPASCGFFVNTEMLSTAARLGYVVVELPVMHRPRVHGVSSVSLREVPRTLKMMAKFWWRSRRLAAIPTPTEVFDARFMTGAVPQPLTTQRSSTAVGSRAVRPAPLRESA
jgi:glycosyltransferase involved in cell wall biosynthesis